MKNTQNLNPLKRNCKACHVKTSVRSLRTRLSGFLWSLRQSFKEVELKGRVTHRHESEQVRYLKVSSVQRNTTNHHHWLTSSRNDFTFFICIVEICPFNRSHSSLFLALARWRWPSSSLCSITISS